MERIILHVDMDAFFAAVEQLDNKDLRGKPVIVGGISERGVVSTCSYEARKYGVHSAMPNFIAQKLCPHGIYVRPRFYRYKEISEEVFKILKDVTDVIERVSIDEAYLDITNTRFKDGMEAAKYIKFRVRKEIGLNISVGISYNKFLAKLASDWNKPNGIKVITKDMIPKILMPLKISKVHGLGSRSVERFNNIGIYTIRDLYEMPREVFLEYLGKSGYQIFERIRGIDNREVKPERDRKSYGKERTLREDTNDYEELLEYLYTFSKEISTYLERNNLKGKTLTLKYKTSNFTNFSKSKTLNHYISSYEDISSLGIEMLNEISLKEKLRLIGLTISSFKEDKIEQMTLF